MSSFESKIPKPVNDVTQSPFANKKPEPLLPDWLEEDKHAAEKDIDKDAEGQQVSNDPLVQHKLEMIRCTEENAKTDPLMQHKLEMIRCTKEKEKTDPLALHKLDMIRCTEEKEKTDPLVLHKLEMIRCTKEKEKTDPLVLHKLEMIRCTKEKEKTDPVVQMKLAMRNMSTLRVSQPDDAKELEADQKSEEVLGAPLKRLEEYQDTVEDKEELSAKSAGSGGKLSVDAATKDYISNLSGGEPMRKQDEQFFGDRFGADFSDVRIHTDSTAAESAKNVNAKAYTKENNIVFGKGQYQPDSAEGKKLYAHELAHVEQGGKASRAIQRKESFTGKMIKRLFLILFIKTIIKFRDDVRSLKKDAKNISEKIKRLADNLADWIDKHKNAIETILWGLLQISGGALLASGGSILGGVITIGSGGILSVVGIPIATVTVVAGKVMIVTGSATIAAGIAMMVSNAGGGGDKQDEVADNLISAREKRSKSYHSDYGKKTVKEITELAQKGDQKARQMKKLINESKRIIKKEKNKGRY